MDDEIQFADYCIDAIFDLFSLSVVVVGNSALDSLPRFSAL
jgi:hypothetical protein